MAVQDPSVDRRSVLSGMVAAFGGLAGCTGTLGGVDDRSGPVSILAAGSLNNALENGLKSAVDTAVRIEAHGSARVARLVATGQKDPDIVSVADIALFDAPLHPGWFAEFVTNSIVIAYRPDSEGGKRLADAGAEGWYRPLVENDVRLGRTDPDLDPLGYRTLFVLELATEYYGTETNLRAAIPSDDQIYPEAQLISQFETGAIDAAIAYRNMAVERDYAYIELPAQIDLGDPTYSEKYATVTYELPDGKVVEGAPISYGSTIRHESAAVDDLFTAHTSGRYLSEFGFTVPDDFPRYTGNVPDRVTH